MAFGGIMLPNQEDTNSLNDKQQILEIDEYNEKIDYNSRMSKAHGKGGKGTGKPPQVPTQSSPSRRDIHFPMKVGITKTGRNQGLVSKLTDHQLQQSNTLTIPNNHQKNFYIHTQPLNGANSSHDGIF